MTLSPRSQEIIDAILAYDREHGAWQASQVREHIDKAYSDAMDLMIAVVTGGDYPHEVFPVLKRFEEFAKQVKIFNEGETPPRDAFWSARELLVAEAKQIGRHEPYKLYKHRLPPVAELREQGVPDDQICRMWGLLDEDKEPRFDLLRREINEPGSVINDDYEHPEDVKGRAQYEEAKRRLQSLSAVVAAKPAPQPEKPKKTPREVWETNRGLGTPILPAQASLMTGVDECEIAELWEQWDEEAAAKSESGEEDESGETGKEKSPTRSQLFEIAKGYGIAVTPKHTNDQIRAKIKAFEENREGAGV